MNQNKWDLRFLKLAEEVSTWSKDPTTKVGSVIADGNVIVSVGFNGFPSNIEDSEDFLYDRAIKNYQIIHAEENAVLFSNRCIKGCTLYVWPMPPCSHCASILIQKKIGRVVCPNNIPEKWAVSMEIAKNNFIQANIKTDYR